jgi:hypothetical protein
MMSLLFLFYFVSLRKDYAWVVQAADVAPDEVATDEVAETRVVGQKAGKVVLGAGLANRRSKRLKKP